MNNRQPEFYSSKSIDFNEYASDFLFEKLQQLELINLGKINIALSGGTTPLPILEILKTKKLNWSKFNFFMVDERVVSIDDDSSNFGNISKSFFEGITSTRFSMVQNGISFSESIAMYQQIISNSVPIGQNGFPQFDLILLGMGDDGHTASLFPSTLALLEQKEFVVLNKVPQLSTERITLTYPVILNSKEIIVLVKGERKKEIIEELYTSESHNFPISKIIQTHENLKWLTD
ncbi:6-phosphogluconolactonase [Flavobacterium sp.]|uniref:6-phosphogluconolactonase n=1 Tax=Flavobacterium sp. TaxID=239 RepID=UPI00286E56E0|nr:6-phosphogluconolactonase [Flavobacterium sp.]